MSTPAPALGLTLWVPLATSSKLFSAAPNDPTAAANQATSDFDLGWPGALPQLNGHAVILAVRAAAALGADVRFQSRFVRRHEAGPNWPRGYQLTQREEPLASGGEVAIADGRTAHLRHIALEEGGARVHDDGETAWVDTNPSGAPYLRIDTEPCLQSATEVLQLLAALPQRLRFEGVLATPDASLRCQVSVALRSADATSVGPTVVILDLPTPAAGCAAIEQEVRRQLAIVAAGGSVVAEARRWHPDHRVRSPAHTGTFSLPFWLDDPDVPPLIVDSTLRSAERQRTAESPAARADRYARSHSLPSQLVAALLVDRATGDQFEHLLGDGVPAAEVAHWLIDELVPLLRERGESLATTHRRPEQFTELLGWCRRTQRTVATTRQLQQWLAHPHPPAITARSLGLDRCEDDEALRRWLRTAVQTNPELAHAARRDDAAAQALLGHAQRLARGRAAADRLRVLLQEILGGAASIPPA